MRISDWSSDVCSSDLKATRAPIRNEANNGLSNKTGTLAMARTMEPHSASAQFFINVKDNDFLDHSAPTVQGWGSAVFGEVTEEIGRASCREECVSTWRSRWSPYH